jgi:chemotaxis-related protein WspB
MVVTASNWSSGFQMPPSDLQQHLLFRVGSEFFAVALLEIEVILPVPDLEPLAQAPAHVAGILRYRGRLIPVIDVGVLRGVGPVRRFISTRLILVQSPGGEPSRLALLVEHALEVAPLSSVDSLPEAVLGEGGHWLHSDVLTTGSSLVRAVNWSSLLTPDLATLCPIEGIS